MELIDLPQLSPALRTAARLLHAHGIGDPAWRREDALAVLDCLDGTPVIVLGSDVYRIDGEHPVPAYDNWSCEPLPGESAADYAGRSRERAREYIHAYPRKGDPWFALVATGDSYG